MALDTFIFVFVDLKATTRIKLATAGLGGTIFIRFQVSSSNFGLKRTTEKHCRIIILKWYYIRIYFAQSLNIL